MLPGMKRPLASPQQAIDSDHDGVAAEVVGVDTANKRGPYRKKRGFTECPRARARLMVGQYNIDADKAIDKIPFIHIGYHHDWFRCGFGVERWSPQQNVVADISSAIRALRGKKIEGTRKCNQRKEAANTEPHNNLFCKTCIGADANSLIRVSPVVV